MHNVLEINLRYRPKIVITISFHVLIYINIGIIPLHKIYLVAFRTLYLSERSQASSYGHDTEPLRLDKHDSCTQKCCHPLHSSILCVNDLYKCLSCRYFSSKHRLLFLFTNWWAGPRIYHKQ